MNGDPKLYQILDELNIEFEYHEHPPAPTIEAAMECWKDIEATHCKNIFFRNKKGNRHYLVIFKHSQNLAVRDLEQRLKQGKLSFASEKRLDKYLGLKPGAVSIAGLLNDHDKHVHVFLDENLLQAERISFHPNINTATVAIAMTDFKRLLTHLQNSHEFLTLY